MAASSLCPAAQHGVQRGNVRGGGATAPAGHVNAVFLHKTFDPCGHVFRAERVVRFAVHQFRQASVGQDGNHAGPVFGQPADMLCHFLRAGRAVQADQVHIQRVNDRGRSGNVRANQQGACGLHRDLHKNGELNASFCPGDLDPVDCRLDLKCVLAGFDQHRIHAAFNQAAGLLGQSRFQTVIINVAKGGQLGARPHGPQHVTVAAIGKAISGFARKNGGGTVDLTRAVCQPEFAQRNGGGAKSIGFHHVCPGLKIPAVDLADQFRA